MFAVAFVIAPQLVKTSIGGPAATPVATLDKTHQEARRLIQAPEKQNRGYD
jgi:hypothetical protein